MQLYELTIKQAIELLKKGETSPKELLEALLSRIEAIDSKVKAFVTVTADEARAQLGNKTDGALSGIPLGIKDNMCTKGVRTTCSSRMLENFVPPYESTATQKLWDAGAVLLGKLNMDEFAMGSSTEHSAFFRTCNPWDLKRVTGGSSGGSAAAVASDMCLGALGSDTGGSIRQPAAFCSVVGLKPTYGRVSRFGLVAFASSLDQIGPITKTVEDSAILLNAICGHDPQDSTSAPEDMAGTPDFTKQIGRDIKGLRVGVPKEYFIEGLDAEVEKINRDAIKQLEALGAELVEVSLPHTDYAVPVYYIIAPSEASSNLARYDGVKYGFRAEGASDLMDMYMKSRSEGFGAEVKRRIMLGTYALSSGYYDAYYLKAQQVRTLIKKDFHDAFKHVDVIASPTTPEAAFLAGEKTSDPIKMYLSDIFTISANLAGNPGISLPCGFTKNGLPVGLQLIGKHFDEATVLKAAHAYEQSTDWHTRKPAL
ncbi:MAG: Asp-tRNA(Asn)/Glu-tRNA(Gln) amidotransferase subunit GatA [Thermodesulfovibrionales bacterium]|nr:Asp-tRNA(Asn)/Glu-tRNA(Gln) amidotransferase subunit GatA [Thermodesulfovibrionales bacterium]